MVDMTLTRPLNKGQFGTNRFLIYDYFCSIATVHSTFRRDDDDGRNTVAKARPLVRSVKNALDRLGLRKPNGSNIPFNSINE